MDIDVVTTSLMENMEIDSIKVNENRPMLPIKINGKTMMALIDSGSNMTLLSSDVIDNQEIGNSDVKLISASNSMLNVVGKAIVNVKLNGLSPSLTTEIDFIVIKDFKHKVLIGMDTIKKLGLKIDFNANKIIKNEFEYIYGDSKSDDNLYIEDDRLEVLAVDDSTSFESTKEEISKAKSAADRSDLPETFKQQLVNLLLYYMHIIALKPSFIKDYLFTNELVKAVVPRIVKPYPIPLKMLAMAKEKIQSMVDSGILTRVKSALHTHPAFFGIKPNKTLRLLINAVYLNQFLLRRAVHIPTIDELLYQVTACMIFTALDLTGGYNQVKLDPEFAKYVNIVLPFGTYQYNVMPQGLKTSVEAFQGLMRAILGDLEFVLIYLDDILILSKSPAEHIEHVKIVLQRIIDNHIRINLDKSYFGVLELKYLGFILNQKGIRANPEKVDAIYKMPIPGTQKDLRSQLCSISFFRRFIPNLASIVAPLNNMIGKNRIFTWNNKFENRLLHARQLLAKKTLLVYPRFDKTFHIYCDASDYGVGVAIFQYDDKEVPQPIYFYSKKFHGAQLSYSVVHKEALAVISILQHLRKILYGCKLVIYTDSLNLSHLQTSNSRKLQRYHLEISDFDFEIKHIAGADNVVADYLSRMDYSLEAKNEILSMELFPLSTNYIRNEQLKDREIQKIIADFENGRNTERYHMQTIEEKEILCLKDTNRMIVAKNIQKDLLTWTHETFGHPGISRMTNTLKNYVHWRNMAKDIAIYVQHCHICQISKKNKRNYGKLTASNIDLECRKFEVVAIDIVGPMAVSDEDGFEYNHILTIIDIKTRYIELVPLNSTTGLELATAFDEEWICRYPRPRLVLSDQGKNLIGKEMEELLDSYGIRHTYTTTYNPQCNSICERAHYTINEHLRCIGIDDWHKKLPAVAWYMRASYHSAIGTSPGALIYGRDMIMQNAAVATFTDDARIRRQQQDLERTNRGRVDYEYRIGDLVLIENPRKTHKFSAPYLGPFTIVDIRREHNYMTIRREHDLLQKINYRRVIPYRMDYSTGGQNVATQGDMNDIAPIDDNDGNTNQDGLTDVDRTNEEVASAVTSAI